MQKLDAFKNLLITNLSPEELYELTDGLLIFLVAELEKDPNFFDKDRQETFKLLDHVSRLIISLELNDDENCMHIAHLFHLIEHIFHDS